MFKTLKWKYVRFLLKRAEYPVFIWQTKQNWAVLAQIPAPLLRSKRWRRNNLKLEIERKD